MGKLQQKISPDVPLAYGQPKLLPSRRGAAFWAFVLNRISGVLLAVYLIFHLFFLSNLFRGREAYAAFIGAVSHPVVVWMEILLVAAVIYHGLNGIRLTMVGLGYGVRRQAELFWAACGLGLFALVLMAIRMLAAGEVH